MSEPRRKGRLFRDQQPAETKPEPPPEKPPPEKPPTGPLVRQTDKTLPPHDGSLNEKPNEPPPADPKPTKTTQKPQKEPSQTPDQKQPTPPPPKAKQEAQPPPPPPPPLQADQQSNARSTMQNMNTETKKHFRFVEKWMEFYGFKKTVEGRKRADIDLYRDTPVRLLGYSEEVGEALRPFIPTSIVRGSYLVTSVYILADTMDKTVKTSEAKWESKKIRQREIEKTLIDTLAWQGLASIVIPGVIINRSVFVILYVMGLKKQLPRSVRSFTTAGICLAIIPNVVKPIDNFVDYFLEHTLRRMLKRRQPPY